MAPEFRLITIFLTISTISEAQRVCVPLQCKKANGCYCVVARCFYSARTDDVCGDTPYDIMESPCVLRHNIRFRYKAPSGGRFQGDEECEFCEVISCSFGANQVSSSLHLFSVMIPTPSRVVIPSSWNSWCCNLRHGFPPFAGFPTSYLGRKVGHPCSTRVSYRLPAASWFSFLGRVPGIRSP